MRGCLVISLVTLFAAAPLWAQLAPEQPPVAPVAAQPLSIYAILYRPGPSWREGVPMVEQSLGPHGRYIADQARNGRVRAAGPFASEGGIVLLRVASEEEAQAFVAADPAVVAGLFEAEIELWTPRFRESAPFSQ